MLNRFPRIATLGAFALTGTAGFATTASAAVANFDIDPTQSSISIVAELGGTFASEQTPGSDTTNLDGLLLADPDGGMLLFPGGSAIDALPQAVPQEPAPGGTPGSAPADFGLTFSFGLFGSVDAAGRNFVFDLSGGPTPITGDTYAATGLVLTVLSGTLDYNGTILGSPATGSADLAGESSINEGTTGTLSTQGGVQTLTVPISTTLTFEDDGVSGTVTLNGQIVASRPIPEPAMCGTLVAAGLLGLRRRR